MLTETNYMVVSGTTDTASVTSDSYNSAGQLLYSVNGVGDTTAYSYDADGNTVQEVDGYGTTDSATTQYQYDRAGGQTAIIDPAGDTTNFALNADGQTVGMTEDLGTSTSSEAYTYNLAGQLVQTIDENGGTEAYVNDADGRVTGETWYNSGGTAVESFSYSYDEAGNMLTAMNTQGMDTFSYSFTYNAAGEVLTVSEPFGVSLSFGYNLAGERTTVSDSFGGSESLTYDADGDLTSLTYNVSGSTVSMNFTYNQAGQQTQESMYYNFGLIATVSESYDADGDVLKIVDTNTSAATIDSFSYAYDLANEVTTESDYSGASTSYTYNAAGELINAGTQTYNYDAAGDADSTGDNDSGGNEQTSFVDPATGDTLDYTYDNAGNELTKTDTNTGITWTYGYNNANQVVTATETNSSSVTQEVVNYEYDAFGNMLKETTTPYVSGVAGSSTVTEFAVDGWNPAKSQAMGDSGFDTWAVMNGSGALQTRNLIGNQIDQILARVDNATNGASDPSGVYFTLTDKNGSVRDVLNSTANAAPVDVITYDAWGNILSQTSTNGSVTTPSDYLGHYSWDGYDYDTADSLYLDHARIYDAASQRWMSQDPMGYAAGDSNLYRYVNNAPTNATDPSGEKPEPWNMSANWKDGTGAMVYTSQMAIINFGKDAKLTNEKLVEIEDYVWKGLKSFKDFNQNPSGKIKNIATTKVIEHDGQSYAEFSTSDWLKNQLGQLAGAGDGPNGEVYVRLFFDEKAKTITGITLGNHMIVGVRQWKVKVLRAEGASQGVSKGDTIIQISTAAWEQRNGLRTNAGFSLVGKDDMLGIWTNYLSFIEADVVGHFSALHNGAVGGDHPKAIVRESKSKINPFSKYIPDEQYRQPKK